MGSMMKEFDGLESARDLAHQSRDWEFLVGTAISVYQNSGGGGSRNNWSEFENQRTRFGLPTIEVGAVSLVPDMHVCMQLCIMRNCSVGLSTDHARDENSR